MRKTAIIGFIVLAFTCLLTPVRSYEVLAALPVPSGKFFLHYAQEPVPVLGSAANEARPVGVGPVAAGGDSLTIRIALEETGPVDVYLILVVPSLASEPFVFTAQGWQVVSTSGLVPWKKGFLGPLDETIVSGLPLSALPKAMYTLILGVTLPDGLDSSYVWMTQFGSSTTSIGQSGGTAFDPDGAAALFPDGALSEKTIVSVFTHHAPATLPAPAGGPHFPVLGGASFGPDGLTFNKPVTITIPLSSQLPSGTVVPLFMYDPKRSGWRMTQFSVTVSPDGNSAAGQVTHFTDYIIMARDRENVDMFFGEFNRKFFDVCNIVPIPSLFEAYISGFSAAFPLGGKHDYDFTAHYLRRMHACYEIVGVDYALSAARMIPDPGSPGGAWKPIEQQSLLRETGRKGPLALVFLYDEVREISDSTCGEYQLAFQWDVTVYLQCSQPDLTLTPSGIRINVGETAPLRGTLTCGGEGMAGETITFSEDGRGILDKRIVSTDRDGFADARLTGTSGPGCSDGQARISASYNSCPGQGDVRIEKSALADVLFSLSGRWRLTEVADETACLEGVNTYTLTATVSQEGNTVSMSFPGGRASGTKSGCFIDGWGFEREDVGVTKGLGSLSIAPDGQSMSGELRWTWQGDELPFECAGSSRVTARRLP